jgi:hypothetical protein
VHQLRVYLDINTTTSPAKRVRSSASSRARGRHSAEHLWSSKADITVGSVTGRI